MDDEFIDIEQYDRMKLLEATKNVRAVAMPTVPHILPQTPNPKLSVENNVISSATPIELQGWNPLFGLDNLVDVHYFVYPDLHLHDWQAEELLRLSGYTNGKKTGPRIHWFKHQPFIASHPCANGSGKDKIIIATFAYGMPLLYEDFYTVVTSSSHEQLKNQTQNHIRRGIDALNEKLGFKFYDAVEFYAQCKARGAEIKLFATDEPGRAEGWHPLTERGRLAILINETKSIAGPILDTFDRCRGYSHWLEISSPGMRSGSFYENVRDADKYPEVQEAKPFRYFSRRVTAYDCPHITKEEIDFTIAKHKKKFDGEYIIQTSIFANFAEASKDVVIPFGLLELCTEIPLRDPDEIGIGLDCAAGGDETVVWVRKGNWPLAMLAFHEADTDAAIDRIDNFLDPYRDSNYIFKGDDGGVGHSMLGNLVRKRWKVVRCCNQSTANNKQRYLNRGAEMYFHTRDLFEAQLIKAPTDENTRLQLCTRRDNQQEGLGKHKLESKKKLRADGVKSPDRGDAFVLCFDSYRPESPYTPSESSVDTSLTTEELIRLSITNPSAFAALFEPKEKQLIGTPTILR